MEHDPRCSHNNSRMHPDPDDKRDAFPIEPLPTVGLSDTSYEGIRSSGDVLASSPQTRHEPQVSSDRGLEHVSYADQTDELRLERARHLALPDSATWAEIFSAEDEQERAALADALDMPTYPAVREYGLSEYPSWRNLFTAVLGLPTTATIEQILARVNKLRDDG